VKQRVDTRKLEAEIRNGLTTLRNRIRSGDDSQLLLWIVDGMFAVSQRPLRDDPEFGGRAPLPANARPRVVRWVERVRVEEKIRSIITLLEPAQLEKYYGASLGLNPAGLIGYYQSQGLSVRHIPATDYVRPPDSTMREALRAFQELPKPVLMQCSAGIDRTTPVAAFIVRSCAFEHLSAHLLALRRLNEPLP
jgi:hypothetical protein